MPLELNGDARVTTEHGGDYSISIQHSFRERTALLDRSEALLLKRDIEEWLAKTPEEEPSETVQPQENYESYIIGKPIGKAKLRLRSWNAPAVFCSLPVEILQYSPDTHSLRVKGDIIGENLVSITDVEHVEFFSEKQPPSPTLELNLRALLTGDVNRLRYIDRYSTSLVIHKESVAAHCFLTSLYALFICEWLDDKSIQKGCPDRGTVLSRALVHDIEECITGDIQRPFKYSDPEFSNLLKQKGSDAAKKVLRDIYPNTDCDAEWQLAKDDSIEGSVVALADFLSVLSYLCIEITNMNLSIADFYESMNSYADIFNEARFDLLRPIVVEARVILSELIARIPK